MAKYEAYAIANLFSRITSDITWDGRLIDHSCKRRTPSSRACHGSAPVATMVV